MLQDREVREAEEVHLQESDLGHLIHSELGSGNARLVALIGALQGNVLDQRVTRDHHPCSMRTGVTGDPFELLSCIKEALHAGIGGVGVLHLR